MNDPVDNSKNYSKFGVYYNPDDPRIIVPKRMRWAGFTLNFAKTGSYLLLVVTVLIVILFINLSL